MSDNNNKKGDDIKVDAAEFRENQAHYFGEVHHAGKSAIVMKYRKPFVVVSSEKKYRRYKAGYEMLEGLLQRHGVALEELVESGEENRDFDVVIDQLEDTIQGAKK